MLLQNEHLHGKFTAGERRGVFTKWIGEAWAEMSSKQEMIERAFRKCGISVAVDGSENDEIHIEGLEMTLSLMVMTILLLTSMRHKVIILSMKTNNTNMYCTSNLKRIITCIHF